MSNVNDSFFDGHYKDVWRAMIPSQLTEREVAFMIDYFHLLPGDAVLDVMCGYGRHSIALALQGINVTAVDNLKEYIDEIDKIAESKKLPITAIKQLALAFDSEEKFKLIVCMGNSLNFFNPIDTETLLKKWAINIESGGHVLINSWSLAETVIPQFAEKSNASLAGVDLSTKSRYLFHPTRIETETKMTTVEGRPEYKLAIDYIYSVNEIEVLLNKSGFLLVDIFSIPGKQRYTLGAPRAYIIGRRN